MKKQYVFLKFGLVLALFFQFNLSYSQNSSNLVIGDLAFVAFNADGDDDFAIVALKSIGANSVIYFSDGHPFDVPDGNPGEGMIPDTNDGFLIWNSGNAFIPGGTVIVFNDVSTTNRKVSLGTLTAGDTGDGFSLDETGEAIFAFNIQDFGLGDRVSNWICGIQSVDGQEGTDFSITNLTKGTTFIEFFTGGSTDPDGGYYSGSRSSETAYADYTTLLGNNTNWTREDTNGENILPISTQKFTIKASAWTGTSSSSWHVFNNWSNGVPNADTDVTIPSGTARSISISAGTTGQAGNLTIASGATFDIAADNALTVHGNLVNNGTITASNASSIIAKSSTTSATINYKRTVTNGWHLISSPVTTQNINDFAVVTTANSVATNGANYGIAPYNNDGTAWNYYTTGNIASAGAFISGKGYSALRTIAGDFTFTGNFPTENTSNTISDGTANEWNLVGNPYPSYLPANNGANSSINVIASNTSVLHASYQALYFWDQATSQYLAVNHGTASRFIAPGQGFFVNSIENGGTSTFTVTEDMQSHQTTDVFSRTNNNQFEISLFVTDGTNTKSTDIKYINGTTTGLDPGYDAGLFNGTSSSFSLYSHLISDSEGIDFSLQCLPDSNYENMIVPVGLNVDTDTEVTFTLESLNIPDGLKVFLEDKENDSFTRLDETNTNYITNVTSSNNGIGRFYIHTTNQAVLDIVDNNINQVSIYKTDNHMLRIAGLLNGQSSLKIYDILGKQHLETSFQNNGVNDIQIPKNIGAGVYIIQLISENNTINKKILIH
jgi:hypothetical protein